MRAGSDPSTRFKVYDLDAGEYDVFALPLEAVQIVWTDQYNSNGETMKYLPFIHTPGKQFRSIAQGSSLSFPTAR